jgi:hypothetical protein
MTTITDEIESLRVCQASADKAIECDVIAAHIFITNKAIFRIIETNPS